MEYLNIQWISSNSSLRLPDGTSRPLSYFLKDFWLDYSEPYSRGFPLISQGPSTLCFVLLAWLLLLVILSKTQANSKWELRPLMLLFNSFQFAVNFLGFLVVAFYISDYGINLWSCTFRLDNKFHLNITVYMGYLYILAKLIELTRPIIAILRGRSEQVSHIDCFGQMYYLVLIYIGFNFRPFGVFIFLPLVDLLHHSFVYVYLIFACTGTQLMKSLLWWKMYLPLMNMLKFSIIFAHSIMTFSKDCHEPMVLKYLECSYALFGFIFACIYMLHFVDRESEAQKHKKAN